MVCKSTRMPSGSDSISGACKVNTRENGAAFGRGPNNRMLVWVMPASRTFADRDELIDTKPGNLVMGGERIVSDPPPRIGVEDAGKKVHDRVNIR